MIKTTLFSASLAIAIGGCASYPAPNDHLATSMASLRAAQEVGANNHPQAALHVRLAQEEVNRAKQLMADGDNEKADYETMRANADAQLAIMLMRETAAETRAQQATARLQQVGAQTMTTSGTQTTPTTGAAGTTSGSSGSSTMGTTGTSGTSGASMGGSSGSTTTTPGTSSTSTTPGHTGSGSQTTSPATGSSGSSTTTPSPSSKPTTPANPKPSTPATSPTTH